MQENIKLCMLQTEKKTTESVNNKINFLNNKFAMSIK